MTPKEKASELVTVFWNLSPQGQDRQPYFKYAVKCAATTVDEIIDALSEYDQRNGTYELQNMDRDFNYWGEVRKEIEKL